MTSVAHTLSNIVNDIQNTHKNTKDIEMELRLGKMKGNRFDTSISAGDWNSVKKALDKYEGWEKKEHGKYVVFRAAKGGVRLTEDEQGERTCIKKTVREKRDLPVEGWNIRFSAAVEKPHKEPDEFDEVVNKERWSYLRKGIRIDMTQLSPEDKDSEEHDHQIELEFVKIAENDEERFNQVYKVFDILKLLNKREDPLWAINLQQS